jgi:hypothetical protein
MFKRTTKKNQLSPKFSLVCLPLRRSVTRKRKGAIPVKKNRKTCEA